jgi:hypothetical protein
MGVLQSERQFEKPNQAIKERWMDKILKLYKKNKTDFAKYLVGKRKHQTLYPKRE